MDKMKVRGVGPLTDCELLSLLIGDEATAYKLFEHYGSLSAIADAEVSSLRMVGGLGLQKAHLLKMTAEVGRRMALSGERASVIISSSDDVVQLMRPHLESLAHEECWALYLNNSNRVIERQRISQGGIQATVVDHRLVVKRALELLSTRLILVHNHPSGAALPSGQDEQLTRRLKEAAALFDIQLLDHLIIAREGSYSFKQHCLL